MDELDRPRAREDVLTTEVVTEVDEDEFEIARDHHEAGIDTSVGAVVRDGDGRLALVRNYWSDGWVIPGGKVHPGENLSKAAVREVREETGLDATAERPLEVVEQEFSHGGESVRTSFVVFEVLAENPALGDAPDLGEFDAEIEAVEWFREVPESCENADLLARHR